MTKEPEYHVGCGLFGVYAGTLMKPKKDGLCGARSRMSPKKRSMQLCSISSRQWMGTIKPLPARPTSSQTGAR